jgi:hypothetical protein
MLERSFVILSLALVACGGPLKYQVPSSAKAPGADANIVADVNETQRQTQLEVEIENLAPAERVASGATSYVAWYRPSSKANWSRIGGVQLDADSRAGKLVGSVPETAFDFSVSAESTDAPASPSTDIVFAQRIGE